MSPRSEAVEVAGVRLTSPGKVLFPKAGVTKRDLARYYVAVAGRILPHLAGRPVSFVRCPEGEDAACFFQRHVGRGMPPGIDVVHVPERTADGRDDYMVLHDLAGLLGAVQVGTLELHVWGAREDRIERAERLVFDLDPDEGLAFADVRAAAGTLRGFLQELGLASFPMVTGGKGVHVIAPIARRRDWPVVKGFALAVAQALARAEPERFTTNIRKKERVGRIFLDYLRNERGSTAICPWSTRAREHAPVAMPVSWDELAGLERADGFDTTNAPGRVDGPDPWPGYHALRQGITREAAARLDVA
jgi:bifunctional non-homologous end joining protein LigD